MHSPKRDHKRSGATRRKLLILLGKLAAQKGDRQQAVKYLEDAGQFATQAQFYRMEADAMFELAQIYRDAGDLPQRMYGATQGLAASQRVGIVIMCLATSRCSLI